MAVQYYKSNGDQVPVREGDTPLPVKSTIDQYVISTATPKTAVPVAASSTLVLAANANRKAGSTIGCDTTAISYFQLGAAASATSFYEQPIDGKTTVPGSFRVPDGWLGEVYAFGASATGNWRPVELT